MSDEIRVLLGIDMETDVGSFTPYYEGLRKGTPRLLELFDRHRVKATFYFVGEAARSNPDVVQMCVEHGHEIGCHSLYHETVGDELFPIPGVKPLLPHEVEPRLKLATEWIESAAGVRPVSFRSPRLWGSTAVIRALANLGYATDASYPLYFYRERFDPYWASLDNWTQPGDGPILELPNFADMAMESKDPGLERDRDQWPLFRTQGAQALLERINAHLAYCAEHGHGRFLALYLHPWEFHPMAERYHFGEATVIPDRFITQNCGERAVAEFDRVIVGLQDLGARFVTAGDMPALVGRSSNVGAR